MSDVEEDMKYFILEIDILINNIINMQECTATGIVAIKQPLILKIHSFLNEYNRLQTKIKDLQSKLEEANKQLDLDYVDKNYIPVEKVKEIVKEAIEIIESEQFKIIMGDMTKVGRLRWLLEIKLLEDK